MAWDEREEEVEAQLNRGALWAISYGDLMSYLAIFFLILYTASSSRSVQMQMGLKDVESHFGNQGNLIAELFSHRGVQQIARLEIEESRIRIVFLAPVLFDSGKASLKESSFQHLKKLAQSLAELPNPIQIEGHTDNQPLGPHAPFSSNWELSSARAFAVLRYFETNGIPSQRLSAIGYGEYKPVASNDGRDGRQKNRRVEIVILPKTEKVKSEQ